MASANFMSEVSVDRRCAPQPSGMRRGPALPADGEAGSTLLSVLPEPVG